MKKYFFGFIFTLGVGIIGFIPSTHAQIDAPPATEIQFDSQLEGELFPGWKQERGNEDKSVEQIAGIIGQNNDGKRAFQYIPRIIDLAIKFIAPILVILCIYAGVMFVNAGSDEEQLKKAKEFFMYAVIGLAFIVLSYSIMRAVYYILSVG